MEFFFSRFLKKSMYVNCNNVKYTAGMMNECNSNCKNNNNNDGIVIFRRDFSISRSSMLRNENTLYEKFEQLRKHIKTWQDLREFVYYSLINRRSRNYYY